MQVAAGHSQAAAEGLSAMSQRRWNIDNETNMYHERCTSILPRQLSDGRPEAPDVHTAGTAGAHSGTEISKRP